MGAARAVRLCLLGILALGLAIASLRVYDWVVDGRLASRISSAYAKGLDFLAKSQLDTGEVPTYAWRKGEEAKTAYVKTPNTAAQVLHSLSFGEGGDVARLIRERAVAYLLFHKEPPGLWRYYGKDDSYYPQVYAQFGHPKLPLDTDDTAQAWSALSENGVAVDPGALPLLEGARSETGLFNLWIATPDEISWMDSREREPDLGNNLNVLFLFARLGRPVPEVCKRVVESVRTGVFHRGTLWYPSPLTFTYFLSRAYADGGATCLREALPGIRAYVLEHQQPDGRWGDDVQTALAVLTLLNLGERGEAVRRGIRAVLAQQQSDGGWASAPMYRGAVFYYGSRALTTSLCLEALGKYRGR